MAAAEPAATRRSDLPVRVASAVVMVAVAGTAFGLRGWFLNAFVIAIVCGIVVEWTRLVFAFARRPVVRTAWLLAGVVYLGVAGYAALVLLAPAPADWPLPIVVGSVVVVDVGAYFAGRTFGGPRIAPAISPSKTWSGLGGAILAASVYYLALIGWEYRQGIADVRAVIARDGLPLDSFHASFDWWPAIVGGTLTAVVAQSGDFFESWMKRRAGVKDSGRLIPGHGGLFDRADGLIAVLFVVGIFGLIANVP